MESPERRQLKNKLRGELLAIGYQAVHHAMRFNPSGPIREMIERCIDDIRKGQAGPKVVLQGCYSLDNNFNQAAQGLQALAQETRTPRMYDLLVYHIFQPCWDAAIFGPVRTAQAESDAESTWQDQFLRPPIDKAFEEWRKADAALKRQEKKSKLAA